MKRDFAEGDRVSSPGIDQASAASVRKPAPVLAALAESSMDIDEIAKEMRLGSGGRAAMPLNSLRKRLEFLEKSGLIQSEGRGKRRLFQLTESGRGVLAGERPIPKQSPPAGRDPDSPLRAAMAELRTAVMEVAEGSADNVSEAVAVLEEARTKIRQLRSSRAE